RAEASHGERAERRAHVSAGPVHSVRGEVQHVLREQRGNSLPDDADPAATATANLAPHAGAGRARQSSRGVSRTIWRSGSRNRSIKYPIARETGHTKSGNFSMHSRKEVA